MTRSQPVLNQVNIIVRDMDAALAFYRRLGLTIPDLTGDWPPGSGARHAAVEMPGMQLEFDNHEMVRIWYPNWRDSDLHWSRSVIGFGLPAREAVDERYAELTSAGYTGRQQPYDGFWGARYAVVQDPDGNDVGLMSPIDPARRFMPSV